MKIIVDWSKSGRERAQHLLREFVRPEMYANPNAWLCDCFDRVSDRVSGVHEPEYEIDARCSVTGNALTIAFSDTDFEWKEEID